LLNGKAGGHKSPLSSLDSDVLFDAYQNALARIDATDTLVASFDVIIIGAGAAGMMCAIESGKRGKSVLVIRSFKKDW
jgi:hypothetical protein